MMRVLVDVHGCHQTALPWSDGQDVLSKFFAAQTEDLMAEVGIVGQRLLKGEAAAEVVVIPLAHLRVMPAKVGYGVGCALRTQEKMVVEFG